MKRTFILFNALIAFFALTGCHRSSGDVWEDCRTSGRYMGRGVKSLAGKHGDSRQFNSRDQFGLVDSDGNPYVADGERGTGEEYTPMDDTLALNDREGVPQSHLSPGDPQSGIPGIDGFKDPAGDAQLGRVFKNIHFDYNSPLVKGDDNLETLRAVSDYMKAHPNTYIFVEGHCDERGPQSYNFALGSNRSNTVRNLLVKEGVNLDNVFTISYGKERPVIAGDGEHSWAQNRRAQFKVYTR